MKRLVYLAAAAAAAVSLTACMDMDHHHGGPYAGGYIDGYYDDAYGPVYDGYWGDGDAFYYRGAPDSGYRRDDGHHFSHSGANGYHPMHMRAGQAPHGEHSPRAG